MNEGDSEKESEKGLSFARVELWVCNGKTNCRFYFRSSFFWPCPWSIIALFSSFPFFSLLQTHSLLIFAHSHRVYVVTTTAGPVVDLCVTFSSSMIVTKLQKKGKSLAFPFSCRSWPCTRFLMQIILPVVCHVLPVFTFYFFGVWQSKKVIWNYYMLGRMTFFLDICSDVTQICTFFKIMQSKNLFRINMKFILFMNKLAKYLFLPCFACIFLLQKYLFSLIVGVPATINVRNCFFIFFDISIFCSFLFQRYVNSSFLFACLLNTCFKDEILSLIFITRPIKPGGQQLHTRFR